jgi:[ribosomal protein S18]-alanine N-acetyltransferase
MNARLRPEPAFRGMTVADLDAVVVIEQAAYPFPWTRGNFVDSLAAGYRCELCHDEDGVLAGYSVAMPALDEMHLLNLTVAPALQGRGCARALLARLLAHSRAKALQSLWLEVRPSNARARDLYRRLGFAEVGLRHNYYPAPDGTREDAVVMSLALKPEHDGLD